MTITPFCVPKVVKSATKISKIGSFIKSVTPKSSILNRVFSIVKMSAREVTILPVKSCKTQVPSIVK